MSIHLYILDLKRAFYVLALSKILCVNKKVWSLQILEVNKLRF